MNAHQDDQKEHHAADAQAKARTRMVIYVNAARALGRSQGIEKSKWDWIGVMSSASSRFC